MKILVMDTETGGTDPLIHSLLSIGLVLIDTDSREVLAKKEILIKPDVYVCTAKALEINKINLVEHNKIALSLQDARIEFWNFIRDYCVNPTFNYIFNPIGPGPRPLPDEEKVVLAGHNIDFDCGFTKILVSNTAFENIFSHRKFDTAGILRFLKLIGVLPIKSVNLDSALEFFGIPLEKERRHTALGDAEATAKLMGVLLVLGKSIVGGLPSSPERTTSFPDSR